MCFPEVSVPPVVMPFSGRMTDSVDTPSVIRGGVKTIPQVLTWWPAAVFDLDDTPFIEAASFSRNSMVAELAGPHPLLDSVGLNHN